MPKKKTERLSLSIDSKLKRQFDAICAIKGLSMSEINESLISEWIQTNAPPGFFEMFDGAEQTKKPNTTAQNSSDPPVTLRGLVSQWNLADLAKKSRVAEARLEQIANGDKPTEQELIYLGRHLKRPDGTLYQTEALMEIYHRDFPNNHS
ncbi:MAG TPA: hypothetical protein VIQ31_14855, partial [Phormidium sp.]